jgi:hypothetical protein
VGAGGALVATPPASGLVQAVGSVVRVNVNTGTILVNTGVAMARVGFTGAYGDLSGLPPVALSDPTGITGADAVTNIISLTQAEYDAIATPSATTLYVITN